jgi:hypothetical protein
MPQKYSFFPIQQNELKKDPLSSQVFFVKILSCTETASIFYSAAGRNIAIMVEIIKYINKHAINSAKDTDTPYNNLFTFASFAVFLGLFAFFEVITGSNLFHINMINNNIPAINFIIPVYLLYLIKIFSISPKMAKTLTIILLSQQHY